VSIEDADHISFTKVTSTAPAARQPVPYILRGLGCGPLPCDDTPVIPLVRALSFKVTARTGGLMITGPSGSGKTSILRVIMGLWKQVGGAAGVWGGVCFLCIVNSNKKKTKTKTKKQNKKQKPKKTKPSPSLPAV
jgi:hypothetical protein